MFSLEVVKLCSILLPVSSRVRFFGIELSRKGHFLHVEFFQQEVFVFKRGKIFFEKNPISFLTILSSVRNSVGKKNNLGQI